MQRVSTQPRPISDLRGSEFFALKVSVVFMHLPDEWPKEVSARGHLPNATRNRVQVTSRQLNCAIRAGAGSSGIDKSVSMHSLRHAFATHVVEQKVDLK